MKTCARCGLADETVLDLDTGSACHPELRHCIEGLVARCRELDRQLDAWKACGDEITRAVRGSPGPLSDSDVIGEIEALRFDLKAARELLDLANGRADTWQQVAVELNHQLSKLQRVACAALGGTNAGGGSLCRWKQA